MYDIEKNPQKNRPVRYVFMVFKKARHIQTVMVSGEWNNIVLLGPNLLLQKDHRNTPIVDPRGTKLAIQECVSGVALWYGE